MEQNQNRIAPGACPERSPEAPADESASPVDPAPASGLPDFDHVPLRYRHDGLTPEKQREYVEALADSGIARWAAAQIGVSEQAVARVRRRADARSFDLACEAAQRFAARRVRAIAFERAIEGTIKRHYYHGELKSEERVFDNRLLIYLLGKLERQLEPPRGAAAVARDWEPWMEAIEQGLPEPPKPPAPEPLEGDEDGFDGSEVWETNGEWWTGFPPPDGFDGIEEGEPGGYDYKRTLSDAEQAIVDADEAEVRAETIAEASARRDLYFGFEGGFADDGDRRIADRFFSPKEAETSETSGEDEP